MATVIHLPETIERDKLIYQRWKDMGYGKSCEVARTLNINITQVNISLTREIARRRLLALQPDPAVKDLPEKDLPTISIETTNGEKRMIIRPAWCWK